MYIDCLVRANMWTVQTKRINFREIQASLNGKTARYPARREPNIMGIESTTCVLEVPHASVWFHTLASWRSFQKESRIIVPPAIYETTSKLKVLPQRKNFGCELRNSTTLIPLGIDWTVISIHCPINKSRAHGSVSSRFAGGHGSEFLAMDPFA